jgi:sugar lactone lactonase YvrE
MPGYAGDGGDALLAKIFYPTLVQFDNNGSFYFTENAHRVRKVSPCGIIGTVAGNSTPGFSGDGGAATTAQLNTPLGVAFDKSGNMYINDRLNYRIRKVDAITGIITTFAGNGVSGFSGDGGPATDASINGVPGVACDTFGNLFISDHSNNRIRKVNEFGIISTYAGTGISGYTGDLGPASNAQISLPLGITCDRAGNVYFVDGGSVGVRKVDKITGIISTVAGSGITGFSGDGGLATLAKFYNPVAVTTDGNDNVYVADKGNQRVRKIDFSGIITTVAGTGVAAYNGDGGLATAADLFNPEGVACNSAGNLFIADFANHRLRKVIFELDDTMSIHIISGSSYFIGSTVTVNATVSNAGSSYLIRWMNKGIIFATTTYPSVTYVKGPGIDTITARVVSTASYGCYDSATAAPYIIAASASGLMAIPAGSDFSVFPNPATTTLTLSSPYDMVTVAISNLVGETVYTARFTGTRRAELPTGHLPPGMYLIKVNERWVQRFMKE